MNAPKEITLQEFFSSMSLLNRTLVRVMADNEIVRVSSQSGTFVIMSDEDYRALLEKANDTHKDGE